MTANALIEAAKALYASWIKELECVEPPWEDLPEDFRLRMVDATRAAFLGAAAVYPAEGYGRVLKTALEKIAEMPGENPET